VANVIRHIYGGQEDHSILRRDLSRPFLQNLEVQTYSKKNWDISTNPHRALAAMTHDPRMQILRARKKPPNEERIVQRSLIERLIYQMENEN